MSFSNNCKSDKIPGVIKGGNPTSGICEKACIQCDKVLDMCMNQQTLTDLELTMVDVEPATGLVEPYRLISAKSSDTEAIISSLTITPLPEDPCFARVSCLVTIPVDVIFVDAVGNQGVGRSSITIPKDVILHTASPSIMPYRIQATASAYSPNGVYLGENVFQVTACVTIILKVLVQVQLLVPSFGYCYIPPCQEYNVQTCDGVFDLPLYPQENGVDCNCR